MTARDEVAEFFQLLSDACSPDIPQEESIDCMTRAITHPHGLGLSIEALVNRSSFDARHIRLVFGYLERVQHRPILARANLDDVRSHLESFLELLLSSLRSDDSEWGSRAPYFQRVIEGLISFVPDSDVLDPIRSLALSSLSSHEFSVGLHLSKSLFRIAIELLAHVDVAASFLPEFQKCARDFFNEFSVGDPSIGKRIVKIWSLLAHSFYASLYHDDYTIPTVFAVLEMALSDEPIEEDLASLVRATVYFAYKFIQAVDCSSCMAACDADAKMDILLDFLPAFTELAVRVCLALPTSVPSNWQALAAPLLVCLHTRLTPEMLADPMFRDSCLRVALLHSEIADPSDFDDNPVSFYGMAYADGSLLRVDQPRRAAVALFETLCPSRCESVLQFLSNQPYSEGLMFLLTAFAQFVPKDHPAIGDLVRKFFSLDLFTFHELTRLRLFVAYYDLLEPDEVESLVQRALSLAEESIPTDAFNRNPMFFTMALEVLEGYLVRGGTIPDQFVPLLHRFAPFSLTPVSFRVLDLLSPQRNDELLSHCCELLLESPLTRDEFDATCATITAQVRKSQVDLPLDVLCPLLGRFVSESPQPELASVLRVFVPVMASPSPVVREFFEHVVHAITASRVYRFYMAEVAQVILAFVAAHSNWVAAGDLVAMLIERFARGRLEDVDRAGVVRVVAFLVQAQMVDHVADVLEWGNVLVEEPGIARTMMGIELIASVVAWAPEVQVSHDVVKIWRELVETGRFVGDYWRMLAVVGLVQLGMADDEIVGMIVRNEVPVDMVFWTRNREGIFAETVEMPIMALEEHFPDFVRDRDEWAVPDHHGNHR